MPIPSSTLSISSSVTLSGRATRKAPSRVVGLPPARANTGTGSRPGGVHIVLAGLEVGQQGLDLGADLGGRNCPMTAMTSTPMS